MTKQYEITVTILVTVPDVPDMSDVWADEIANKYADIAKSYKSIGADKVLDIIVEPRK
jgi:hypothetical protein